MAIAVTRAVELLGGRVGGLIATLPTTIVPATAGIWLVAPDPRALAIAMSTVPVGMLVDAGFLWLWRVLPGRLPRLGLPALLALTTLLTLSAWAAAAAAALVVVDGLMQAGMAPLQVGGLFTAVHVVVGVAACLTPLEAPKGREPVGWLALLVRGALAAVAIGVSVQIAALGSPAVAGIASIFPAIFLTTMVSLWWSQGQAVPAGAVGPMMLGATAVSGYALFATLLLPALGLVAGSLVSWILAATVFTVPSALWLQSRQSA